MTLRVLFVLYCIEAGFFFFLAPWTRFWTFNPILTFTPAVAAWTGNSYFRGFVSGVGVIHLLAGARELLEILRSRRAISGVTRPE